ncbi:WbqC family protein [Lysinibacillus sp. OL1]|uniref:WbqC family protein n=1 Tax=Lysinibacillus sp. OL1 TaxID=2517243 RepID=UPI00187D2617|nr:WbqC family protein [Lysinibacillus sp. OL1]
MRNKKISIHQSQYLPWAPYFKKIYMSDYFILLDNVQFQKNGVQNRNKIRNKNGDFWITIPVNKKLNENINTKMITDRQILRKHWKMIEQSYCKTLNWELYKEQLFKIYSSDYQKLNDINLDLLEFFLDKLKIETKIIKASDLDLSNTKGDLVLEICKLFDANTYLSGLGSKEYLDERKFEENGIKIEYIESIPPIYKQICNPFIGNLSVLDFLLNVDQNEIQEYFEKR